MFEFTQIPALSAFSKLFDYSFNRRRCLLKYKTSSFIFCIDFINTPYRFSLLKRHICIYKPWNCVELNKLQTFHNDPSSALLVSFQMTHCRWMTQNHCHYGIITVTGNRLLYLMPNYRYNVLFCCY